jgi:hypothetical protein
MARLEYDVYVAPSKLAVSDGLPRRGAADAVADRVHAHPRRAGRGPGGSAHDRRRAARQDGLGGHHRQERDRTIRHFSTSRPSAQVAEKVPSIRATRKRGTRAVAARLVVAGRARPGRIVTHHGRLEDARGLYERFDQRADGVIKAVLQPA